jgi:predicted transcriptional regulator
MEQLLPQIKLEKGLIQGTEVPAQLGIAPDIRDLDILKPLITSRAIASVGRNKKKISKEGASKKKTWGHKKPQCLH